MNYRDDWDLSTIPHDRFLSELGRRRSAMRIHPGGYRENAGRKKELVPCPRCGAPVSKTEARRGHGCRAKL